MQEQMQIIPILTKRVKLKYEKKPALNLKSIENISKHVRNLLRFSFCKNNFFTGKKTVVETILVAITDSSDVRCFDLYLINIFTKSTKVERCTNIMFKLTLYCLSVTVEDLNL